MANLIVTNGGIAAIRNAQATGTNAVSIASVRIGSGQWTPTGAATALKTPIKTYTAIAGGAVGDNIIHVEAMDESTDAFTAYEIGVYLADGTLLAVASSTTAILTKAASAQAMLAVDLVIADASSVQFVFPSATFSVPPATTTIQGVVELATDAEALAGTDAVRAITPKTLKTVADTKAPVNHASNATIYGVASGANYGHSRLSDSISSTSSASGGVSATPKAVKDAKEAAIAAAEQADTAKVAKAGDTVTGAIHSTCGKANTSGAVEQFGGEMAGSDKWRLAAGATASDSGYVALDTADNGSEPILVRQYSGNFATLVRQVALLDGSGKTSFPVQVTCPSFVGALTGNADTATKLRTARAITVKDNSQTNAGPAQNFDGSGNITLRLPATIKGSLDGNAATATLATRAQKDANGSQIDTTYLKRAGGTVTGTLILSRTTDLSGTANNKPALIIGGTDAQAHIEIDNNEIQAKANGTSVGALYLQPDGGVCNVNGKRVVRGTGGGNTKHVYVDGDGNIVASNATVGGTAQGVYLSGGAITKMSGTVGGANQPTFLSGGVIKACNNYNTISMVPAGGWEGRKNGVTYTAGSNGWVYGRNSKHQTCGTTTKLRVHGIDYWLQSSSYGKGSCANDQTVIVPVKKGQTYIAYNLDSCGFISAG
jgi:hypothetical protein